MNAPSVNKPATAPEPKKPRRLPLGCTLRHLRPWRLSVKVFQMIFTLVAVVCEELVEECYNCSALYFFEFVSCGAFLLSLLILYLHCTYLYESLGEDKVQKLNFWAVLVIAACFLSASVLLSATCNEPEEYAASVFGFFSTSAFAAEFVIELCLRIKQKWNKDGSPEKPQNTLSATENQPLNKQR